MLSGNLSLGLTPPLRFSFSRVYIMIVSAYRHGLKPYQDFSNP